MNPTLPFTDDPPEYALDPIGRRWFAYHLAHPEVGEAIIKFAREYRKARPDSKCSTKLILERLRWESAVGNLSPGSGEFKIDNRMSALYARWAMIEYPDLDGLFRLRERRTDRLTPQPFDVRSGGTLPTRWAVLGAEGRVRHLIRKEDEHKAGVEAEALCGVIGWIGHHHASLNVGPACGTCEFRWRQILDPA